ncbi:MAG: DsbA family protein [Proteobacteria bacterium]|nr:DsbA family protein [Pseudomonadota bacterium]
MDREILLIVDPMCSWCWGFSPTVKAIAEEYGDRAPIFPIVGGLRPLNDKPMDGAAKNEIRHHWADVEKVSGQPFDFSFFDRDGFVYDTEPPCRALVTVRALKPEAALSYLASQHKAFYADNRDITDHVVLADLAEAVGVDRAAFVEAFPTRSMIYLTASDFFRAQRMGATGFPTVVLRTDEKLSLLTAGFRPFETLKPHLDDWFKQVPKEPSAAETDPL